MAVPKRKVSKSRRDMRRANNSRLDAPDMSKCKNCGEFVLSHRVCKACGHYNGAEVISKAEEKK